MQNSVKLIFVLSLLLGRIGSALSEPFSLKGSNLFSKEVISVAPAAKGLVLVFLSARCPCSNSHVEILKGLAKEYKEFSFLAVHSNNDEALNLSQEYFKKAALNFPVIQDEKNKLADVYKASKTPHVFLLNPKGEVLYRGGVTSSAQGPQAERNFLQEALVDVQNSRPVRTPQGRTLGCAISREKKNAW